MRCDYIHESVAIHVEQSHAIVAGFGESTPPISAKGILFDPLQRLVKGEELHAPAVFFLCVVNELHPLLRRAPAVRMEDGRHHALLAHDPIERGFPVGECLGIFCAVRVERLPVARCDAWEFPAQFPDDVGIRVVLDEARVVAQRDFRGRLQFAREIFCEALTVLSARADEDG